MSEIPTQNEHQAARTNEVKKSEQELLESVRTFLEADMSTKEHMLDMAPPNSGDIFSYRRQFFEGLSGLREDMTVLTTSMATLGLDDREKGAVDRLEDELVRSRLNEPWKGATETYEDQLAQARQNTDPAAMVAAKFSGLFHEAHTDARTADSFDSLTASYASRISTMRPEFVEKVTQEICGFLDIRPLRDIVGDATSVNELLYAAHTYLQSSDTLYEKLPVWNERRSESTGTYCRATGDESVFARTLFAACSETVLTENEKWHSAGRGAFRVEHMDMLTVGESTQMMVRDAGHALSLDIDSSDPSKILVTYHIPKVTDVEAVKSLPGIGPVAGLYKAARGMFQVEGEAAPEAIAHFIIEVPVD